MINKQAWLKLILFFIIAFLTAWLLSLAVFSYLYTWQLLHPRCVPPLEEYKDYQAVSLQTSDGLELSGWWHAPQNGKVILVLGGLGANKDSMLPTADMLVENGYGVLTISYRHCQGEIATLGETELYELQSMIAYALEQSNVEKLGGLGFSVGGTTILRGAARHPELESIVAIGNFANLENEMSASPAEPLSLAWQIQQFVKLFYHLQTGINPNNISPIDDIPAITPRPILFIQGENEIERTQGLLQYESGLPNAEIWIAPDCGHGEYTQKLKETYQNKILDFFEKTLSNSFW